MNELVETLPQKPGVYFFKDKNSKVIYVGKAVNLKSRVRSYFSGDFSLGPKTIQLVKNIVKIDYIEVESEIEALLLEVDLIKRYRPKYNKQWKDDKAYKYIKITRPTRHRSEDHKQLPTPDQIARVTTARKIEDDGSLYFGPFPEGGTVNYVLKTLRKVFPYCDCSAYKYNRSQKLNRICLEGEIGLCPMPCIGKISLKEYNQNINRLIRFLAGKSNGIINELNKEMNRAAKNQDFEKAAILRDRVQAFEYITQTFRHPNDYIGNPNLVEDKRSSELEDLSKIARSSVSRIEAYDISNLFGKYAVGSMIVFKDGEPVKRDYRKFKIKTKTEPDDVGMISEVLTRRFSQFKLNKKTSTKDMSFSKLPDLILIDGGKPQVTAAKKVLEEVDLNIPILGLAKKFEEIVHSDLSVVCLPLRSPGLQLLQRVRDESHRFALSYHQKLRSQGFLSKD